MSNTQTEAVPAEQPSPGISSLKLFHNIKGIIFDFDGTLFDNARIAWYVIAACPTDIFIIHRERLVRKRFAGSDYYSSDEYYHAFFEALGKTSGRSAIRVRNWYYNRYMPRMANALKKHYKPRAGVKELLQRGDNRAGGHNLKIAVYSDYPFLKERFGALGISPDPAVALYSPESFGAQKPAVRPFLCIANDLQLSPDEILVVGDREDTDGYGAFHAGMRFFCLETGRKRYYEFDPYRRRSKEKPGGPSLLMYAGTWDPLYKLILERFG